MAEAMYIHVPFCDSICAYCDFERCKKHPVLTRKWLKQIISDIQKHKTEPLQTIYIGGGTPTCLSSLELDELLSYLDHFHPIEYTIEANIENLTAEKINILRKHHVNRISLGVQTLRDDLIQLIERHHDTQAVFDKIQEIYESGITNISVDMIYGLPTQTLENWLNDLERIASNPLISHLSIYSLTIEENSAFKRRNITKCSDELDEEMYFEAISLLERYGFEQYEISNFARNHQYSIHNLMYWKYEDFIGIGCGAYGKENHIYYHWPFRLDAYINGTLEKKKTFLDEKEEMFETVMMGLRMKKGIDMKEWKNRFHIDIMEIYEKEIKKNLDLGFLRVNHHFLQCTETGFGLLNSILLDFMNDSEF